MPSLRHTDNVFLDRRLGKTTSRRTVVVQPLTNVNRCRQHSTDIKGILTHRTPDISYQA